MSTNAVLPIVLPSAVTPSAFAQNVIVVTLVCVTWFLVKRCRGRGGRRARGCKACHRARQLQSEPSEPSEESEESEESEDDEDQSPPAGYQAAGDHDQSAGPDYYYRYFFGPGDEMV